MNLKPVQLRLEAEEMLRILQASLDDDAQDALAFVKTVLAKNPTAALSAGFRGLLRPRTKRSLVIGRLVERMKRSLLALALVGFLPDRP